MNIAILGGAFNPVTISHVELAKLILKETDVSEVWITPCYEHLEKKLESPEDRLEMIEIVIGNEKNIKAFDYEIRNKLHGETYIFLDKLLNDEQYNECDFSFILSMDRANEIDKFYKSVELLKLPIRFIVCYRPGIKEDENVDWYLKDPHVFIKDKGNNELLECSSTMARTKLKDYYACGVKIEMLKKMMNFNVLEYIFKHSL